MKIDIRDKEYSIKIRGWNYTNSLYSTWLNRLCHWCFGKWDSNICDMWVDKGFRILGFEFNIREYLPFNKVQNERE